MKMTSVLGKTGLNVIQYPSGRFGFVGRVPAELAYIKTDGTKPSELELTNLTYSSNPSITRKAYGIKTRTFDTREQALSAATDMGYSVDNGTLDEK